MLTWNEIVDQRRQYDCWDLEKPVEKQLIQDIFQEMHYNCPKKQNIPHIKMLVLDWSDPQLRSDIYDFSCLNEGASYGLTVNPQVLANYIVIFLLDLKSPYERPGHTSIGLHASFIAHAATARGLQTGFCQCNDPTLITSEQRLNIQSKLGIRDVENIQLILGVGHGLVKNSMINPYSGKRIPCWSRVDPEWTKLPLPDQNEYIKFL
jgi:hypothetical protein